MVIISTWKVEVKWMAALMEFHLFVYFCDSAKSFIQIHRTLFIIN